MGKHNRNWDPQFTLFNFRPCPALSPTCLPSTKYRASGAFGSHYVCQFEGEEPSMKMAQTSGWFLYACHLSLISSYQADMSTNVVKPTFQMEYKMLVFRN
jgi:hypothetical protein